MFSSFHVPRMVKLVKQFQENARMSTHWVEGEENRYIEQLWKCCHYRWNWRQEKRRTKTEHGEIATFSFRISFYSFTVCTKFNVVRFQFHRCSRHMCQAITWSKFRFEFHLLCLLRILYLWKLTLTPFYRESSTRFVGVGLTLVETVGGGEKRWNWMTAREARGFVEGEGWTNNHKRLSRV